MTITTFSRREFNHDASRAKKAAHSDPVFITGRGRPAHVLLTIEDYRQLTQSQSSIVELLAMSGGGDIDFEPAPLRDPLCQPADLQLNPWHYGRIQR